MVLDLMAGRDENLTNVYPWFGNLEVLTKADDRDLEISIVGYSNAIVLKEEVDVTVGINGAFGSGRWLQGPVAVVL